MKEETPFKTPSNDAASDISSSPEVNVLKQHQMNPLVPKRKYGYAADQPRLMITIRTAGSLLSSVPYEGLMVLPLPECHQHFSRAQSIPPNSKQVILKPLDQIYSESTTEVLLPTRVLISHRTSMTFIRGSQNPPLLKSLNNEGNVSRRSQRNVLLTRPVSLVLSKVRLKLTPRVRSKALNRWGHYQSTQVHVSSLSPTRLMPALRQIFP